MASRTALACLLASWALAACTFHRKGLGAGAEEGDDGGGLVGSPGSGSDGDPGTGGLPSGGSPGTGGLTTGGAPGTGGLATGGTVGTGGESSSPGTGGELAVDAAPPPPIPLDAAPPPPDVAPILPQDSAPPPRDLLPRDSAPPPRDLAPPRDSGAPSPTNTIACGAAKCVAGKQACCSSGAGTACIPLNGVCVGGSVFRCDGPEDCDGGRVCCVRNQNGYTSACARAVECAQAGGAALCHTGVDCPLATPTCAAASGPISVCR
jgi:hypothetical protein